MCSNRRKQSGARKDPRSPSASCSHEWLQRNFSRLRSSPRSPHGRIAGRLEASHREPRRKARHSRTRRISKRMPMPRRYRLGRRRKQRSSIKAITRDRNKNQLRTKQRRREQGLRLQLTNLNVSQKPNNRSSRSSRDQPNYSNFRARQKGRRVKMQ